MLSTSLFAASDTTSGKVDGSYSTYGVVTLGSSKASAQTRCSADAACIAEVTYKYQFGIQTYTESNSNSNLNSTTATATAEYKPAENISAQGKHTVSRNGDVWRGTTVEYN